MKELREWNKLQQAWAERSGSDASHACPAADQIWEAQSGNLARSDVDRIIDHTVGCPACAQAWRLAYETGAMEGRNADQPLPQVTPWWRPRPLAFAAGIVFLLVAATSLLVIWRTPDPTETQVTFRDSRPDAIQSLISQQEPLPRIDFRLTWTPGVEGSRYSLRVTTIDLEPVYQVEGLLEPHHVVPPPALKGLAPNSRLMWQIQVLSQEGRRSFSPTFFATVR